MFLDCGDLERGFARVRCDDCKHEYLLAFRKGAGSARHATRRRSNSSARCCPRRSCSRSRTGISPSESPRCCARTSASTATCSRTCAAWRTSACSNTCAPPRPARGAARIVMAIHTPGEYLDFHPICTPWLPTVSSCAQDCFTSCPDVSLKPLEELFRARIITFLADKGLLPVERANMLRGCAFRVQRASEPAGTPRRARDLERLGPVHHQEPLCRRKDAGHGALTALIRTERLSTVPPQPDIQRNFEVFVRATS